MFIYLDACSRYLSGGAMRIKDKPASEGKFIQLKAPTCFYFTANSLFITVRVLKLINMNRCLACCTHHTRLLIQMEKVRGSTALISGSYLYT